MKEAMAAMASYEDVASEYYNPERHPTCANFREASAHILRGWLRAFTKEDARIYEVGAGDSLVAELLAELGKRLEGLVITDASLSMLRHSARWEGRGARLVVSQAEALPEPDESFDLLVSSLGDPYNVPAFWGEVHRVLRPGGLAFFTTPSYEWASSFRSGVAQNEIMTAEFELSDGRTVLVPSWIYPTDEQSRLIEAGGLVVKEVVRVPRSVLKSGRVSPKLLVEDGPDLNVVTGYLVKKPSDSRH